MAQVIVSRRAALDLAEIESWSARQWGKKAAAEYLDNIEQALPLLLENPGILRRGEFSPYFHFYRVRRHLLVFDITEDTLRLLTVKHGSMDLPERLAEITPHLHEEIACLHKKTSEK
jgi:plasmid stabilization system protein ParE